jgi:hypothetical protein
LHGWNDKNKPTNFEVFLFVAFSRHGAHGSARKCFGYALQILEWQSLQLKAVRRKKEEEETKKKKIKNEMREYCRKFSVPFFFVHK